MRKYLVQESYSDENYTYKTENLIKKRDCSLPKERFRLKLYMENRRFDKKMRPFFLKMEK
jgi:hypothetical protein